MEQIGEVTPAVSPALAVDGSRFAWDIGNDRTCKYGPFALKKLKCV